VPLFLLTAAFSPNYGQSTPAAPLVRSIIIPKDRQLSFETAATKVNENLLSKMTPDQSSQTDPSSTYNKPLQPSAKRPPQQSTSNDGWHFAFAPYLYAMGISGTVAARGRTIEIDSSFGDIWKKLDLGLIGTVEARKRKWLFFTDVIFVKLSSERDTPGGLFSTAKVGINLFILDPEVGYRLFRSKKGFIDVLGGVRIWSVESNVNITTGSLPGFDVSQRKTWAAPIIGARGNLDITKRFFLSTKFDIGGAGIGADLTTQFYGGTGYRITPKIALIGGYRFLQVNYDDHSGFIFDTKMNGLMFGTRFSL
jgi:hypothetical protein